MNRARRQPSALPPAEKSRTGDSTKVSVPRGAPGRERSASSGRQTRRGRRLRWPRGRPEDPRTVAPLDYLSVLRRNAMVLAELRMNRNARVAQCEGWSREGRRAVDGLSINDKLKEPRAVCRGHVAEVDARLGVRADLVAAVDMCGLPRGCGIHEQRLNRSAGMVAR